MQTTRSFCASVSVGFVLVLALALFAGPSGAEAIYSPSAPAASYAEIDAYIQRQMARLNLPGAALAIVEGDEIVHLQTFGKAHPNGAPPTPQTQFFIGSLTKSFTALAVMQLAEAGQIALDAPVRRYLPWFEVADPEASAQITVRQLLNQTSGLSQGVGMIPLADFDDRPGATVRQARTLATFVPTRPPGSAWEYSNMNFNLLGLIIEAAGGESYETYIRNHIFMPLEMGHSYTSKGTAQQDQLAVGHRSWFGVPVAVPDLPVPVGSLPSGQLISSAQDMAHYLIAHLNGGRYGDIQILSSAGIAEMHRPAVQAAAMGVEMGAYGMGWLVEETGQGVRISHNGQVPDYFAYMVLLPEQKRGLVLLVNANQMVLNFALVGISEDVASLLAGAQPDAFPWGIVPWIVRSFLLIPVIGILEAFATRRRLSRWRLDATRRPGPARLWVVHILPPTVFYLVLVWIAGILLASDMRQMILLFMPDLSWLAIVCGSLALLWLLVRTGWMLKIMRP